MAEHKMSVCIKSNLVRFQSLYILLGTFVAICRGVSPLLICWGLRNQIRYIVFFAYGICYLDDCGFAKVKKWLYRLEYVNYIFVIVEYYALGIQQDYIGGIFGMDGENALNGILNCYLVILMAFHISDWMRNKRGIVQMLASAVMSLHIAVLAELKFYFIELILFLALYITWVLIVEKRYALILRIVVIGLVTMMGLSIAAKQLIKLYPFWENYFSIEKIIQDNSKESGYTNSGDINRLTAIQTINDKFFDYNLGLMLLGFGIGAVEFSEGHDNLTSKFYKKNIDTHYHYFSISFIYLEAGIVGLLLYLFSMGSVVLRSVKMGKSRCDEIRHSFSFMTAILSCCLVLYNQSLRTIAAYLMFFGMMATFIDAISKDAKKYVYNV
ncbi:MAG: hypothetical protein IJP92_12230 [Lachnospiraceae bacterium]|nr:hypothetical protein [Lachnospiraceae bacterium]